MTNASKPSRRPLPRDTRGAKPESVKSKSKAPALLKPDPGAPKRIVRASKPGSRASSLDPEELALREAIIAQCRWMNANGLNQNTSGNIGVRYRDSLLVTPSAIPYDKLEPAMIARMSLSDASYGSHQGPLAPSTEWRFHLDILRQRPEVNAVVHTHSTYATTLAIARRSIPACHYMIAAFGGNDVRCSGYARFGSAALSALVLESLQDRLGCLIANHGMIALGESLDKAMWRAMELETLARQYYLSLSLDDAVILTDAEIAETAQAFASYGLKSVDDSPGKRR